LQGLAAGRIDDLADDLFGRERHQGTWDQARMNCGVWFGSRLCEFSHGLGQNMTHPDALPASASTKVQTLQARRHPCKLAPTRRGGWCSRVRPVRAPERNALPVMSRQHRRTLHPPSNKILVP
jgi:hypothetical protein